MDEMDRDFVSKFTDWPFARFYHQMLFTIGAACKEKDLLFLQNSFINEGLKLEILKPGDGKVVSWLFGSLSVNRYGRPMVSISEHLEDPAYNGAHQG